MAHLQTPILRFDVGLPSYFTKLSKPNSWLMLLEGHFDIITHCKASPLPRGHRLPSGHYVSVAVTPAVTEKWHCLGPVAYIVGYGMGEMRMRTLTAGCRNMYNRKICPRNAEEERHLSA
jgi:hypothetical protein